ncbi:hypothetical protein ASPACDRAFT_40594 [Aspergillus aculeatus ATCC 16872]|uniref:F-box domain-containing protein n=1 Tax=Aspergillus aculeatus (strain ATCC 16872 / CBS 172.66 / WB 5094) TaxID=690307 RepID=A0A1L9X4A0_ASPA1|nr:uncharacterized protein ASPACDRAFT_40594 [Aspergillus aculeatus ATCC 16872]OJK03271.1 hypothetical protein ASPACDRAFT_40594 [Aspergillus aculeatus ATCC 16872]
MDDPNNDEYWWGVTVRAAEDMNSVESLDCMYYHGPEYPQYPAIVLEDDRQWHSFELAKLPAEIILECFEHMTNRELANLSQTCKYLYLMLRSLLRRKARQFALATLDEYRELLWIDRNGRALYKDWQTDLYSIPFREPLFEAVAAGDYSLVEFYLRAGVSPNAYGLEGWPLLPWAARNGRLEIALLLLDHPAIDVGLVACDEQLFPDCSPLPLDILCNRHYRWSYYSERDLRLLDSVVRSLLYKGATFEHFNAFQYISASPHRLRFMKAAMENGSDLQAVVIGRLRTTWYHHHESPAKFAACQPDSRYLELVVRVAPEILGNVGRGWQKIGGCRRPATFRRRDWKRLLRWLQRTYGLVPGRDFHCR